MWVQNDKRREALNRVLREVQNQIRHSEEKSPPMEIVNNTLIVYESDGQAIRDAYHITNRKNKIPLISGEDLICSYNPISRDTYLFIGSVCIGSFTKYEGPNEMFSLYYNGAKSDGTFDDVGISFKTRKEMLKHILKKLNTKKER